MLDKRPVRSPGGKELFLPSKVLAECIAREWDIQGQTIIPSGMPMMSLAVTAIDRVTPQRDYVVRTIAAYGGSDLLCYRAEDPIELGGRQAKLWQPLLDWCAENHGATLMVTVRIMPISQSLDALDAIKQAVDEYDDFALAALYEIVSTLGSVVIGLAISGGHISVEEGVKAALLEEYFQIERWGEDKEASERRNYLCREVGNAAEFQKLARILN